MNPFILIAALFAMLGLVIWAEISKVRSKNKLVEMLEEIQRDNKDTLFLLRNLIKTNS